MIAVVALLLIVAPFAVAAGLHALHERGARIEAAGRAARPVGPAEARTNVIPTQLHAANAADWELIARQQRRDGMPHMAAVSDHWATLARERARAARVAASHPHHRRTR